ncbi:hypothetical protein N7532_002193 [Penicillium argentinense]|uniref:Uncharacterized protein n=1 Tax=Penicillium argentinense TaxID=1131581 RepID=A0A9W9EW23_9EURO|nr:uncharacterized protein N7532_010999 [Penicillium argentinense]XP_056470908.1 uncharacterized protein N7532_007610 [Penicillium argentinense]XP_056473024.1 uncharacterized protein N7532_009727 [Penicillium argentinense]XP_056473033.1 uncharacterized protein N7532_007174 [Penicillium argentinense]XP_056475826.1 uncharacterized protein N7532_002975 [Penicillium argentinense]XP_056477658.1 uncharacterized protein N7532_004807 [Penicillium argentinense]XP_056478438.1 uncharacterized protein N7
MGNRDPIWFGGRDTGGGCVVPACGDSGSCSYDRFLPTMMDLDGLFDAAAQWAAYFVLMANSN